MEYGNIIWYPFLRKDIDLESTEKVQKCDTKLIPELKDLTYMYIERLKDLKLPSLAHRRRLGDMIQTFKIIKGFEDISDDNFFKLCKVSTTRGHSLKLEKKLRCKTRVRQQPSSQRIINEWNSLPEQVVPSKDVRDFKSRIGQHWNHEVICQF